MALVCTRCGAESDDAKVDVNSRLAFTHNRGCGSGIGPLVAKTSPPKKIVQEERKEISSTASTETVVVEETKPKKKRSKKKSD